MDENYIFPEPERRSLTASNRELIFGLFAVLLGLFTANMVIFGGFRLGFAIGSVLLTALSWGYLHRCGHKAGGYTAALLVLSLIIAAGFGWYSLAPVLLAEYSSMISAICFLSNVMRELLAFIFIPIVAKHVGYIESTSLAGAAAMDTCLGVTIRATHERIVIFAIAGGMITGTLVAVIIPMLISF